MGDSPVQIGTLIVVCLKAKNLPNKRHVGKQDPYCAIELGGQTQRTKAVKRGGQHPEWDQELRFELFEDVEDVLARTATNDDKPPPPPPKKGVPNIDRVKGGKTMRVACYADDPREPDLIGEARVDVTPALTQGEVDEWFTIFNKDRYAGEVYLELTFWSAAKPPEKKDTSSASILRPDYGGQGVFEPAGPSHPRQGSSASVSSGRGTVRQDSLPQSLRPSSSLATIDLYKPPYERNSRTSIGSPVEALSNQMSEFGLGHGPRRRESFPPQYAGFTPSTMSSQSSVGSLSSIHNIPPVSSGFTQPSGFANAQSPQSPQTPRPSSYHRDSLSSIPEPVYQAGFPAPYHNSGFAPPQSAVTPVPISSGFAPLPSSTSFPGGLTPPRVGATPVPSGFISQTPSYQSLHQSSYGPPNTYPPLPASAPPVATPQMYGQGIQPPHSAPPPQFVQANGYTGQIHSSPSPTHQPPYSAPPTVTHTHAPSHFGSQPPLPPPPPPPSSHYGPPQQTPFPQHQYSGEFDPSGQPYLYQPSQTLQSTYPLTNSLSYGPPPLTPQATSGPPPMQQQGSDWRLATPHQQPPPQPLLPPGPSPPGHGIPLPPPPIGQYPNAPPPPFQHQQLPSQSFQQHPPPSTPYQPALPSHFQPPPPPPPLPSQPPSAGYVVQQGLPLPPPPPPPPLPQQQQQQQQQQSPQQNFAYSSALSYISDSQPQRQPLPPNPLPPPPPPPGALVVPPLNAPLPSVSPPPPPPSFYQQQQQQQPYYPPQSQWVPSSSWSQPPPPPPPPQQQWQ